MDDNSKRLIGILFRKLDWPTEMLEDMRFPFYLDRIGIDFADEIHFYYTLKDTHTSSHLVDDARAFPSDELCATLKFMVGPIPRLIEHYKLEQRKRDKAIAKWLDRKRREEPNAPAKCQLCPRMDITMVIL